MGSIVFLVLVIVAFLLIRRRIRKKEREQDVMVNMIFVYFTN